MRSSWPSGAVTYLNDECALLHQHERKGQPLGGT